MVWKTLVIILLLAVVPLALGALSGGRAAEADIVSCIVNGYAALFALTELIFVPLILIRAPFHTAVYVLAAVLGVLTLVSAVRRRQVLARTVLGGVRALYGQPPVMYAAAALILLQMGVYVFFMATDLDDAYYVAAATTALSEDTMYLNSPYTGVAQSALDARYVLSPMPMLTAFLAKCSGIHAATVAHTVFPVFLVGLAYAVYDLLARQLFHGRKDSAGMFLALLSLIHISSYYSVYTQGTFLLIRIWQGKAVLAAVLLPFLFYRCLRLFDGQGGKAEWALLVLGVLACCMVSSMGIVLAPVMFSIFAVLLVVLQRKWRRALGVCLCCLPCLCLGAAYLALVFAR